MDENTANSTTLYVDLDGTFTKTDLLFESLVIAIKNNPLVLLWCFLWLLKGRSYFKCQLAARANVETSLLPLNEEFYLFLQQEKANGRKLILATASDTKFAEKIYNHYDLFDDYICSDINTNLKGKAKLLRIQTLDQKFSYAGNSDQDFVIFEQCEHSYLVNPTRKAKQLAKKSPPSRTFDQVDVAKLVWVKQLRVQQWVKNGLLFVPLIVSGLFVNEREIGLTILGFISFSLLASATYIINDLFDLESDRSHIRKKNRPLAAGTISIIDGMAAAGMLFVVAFSIASQLNGLFITVLVSYLGLTLTYSLKIKQFIGIDVIALASLYTLRIIAGAVLLDVTLSFWLLSFSMFVFFSLAIIKRCTELKSLMGTARTNTSGRDYHVDDYLVLMSIGTSSAMLSVLMFCFYVNSNVLSNQYQQPQLLWLVVPALCYWMMRMWIKVHRGEMHDDPIVFSLKDRGSLMTIGFMGVIAVVAQIL
ncbi:MAG: UbiA family prenyltransferase [Gammaproteobacteria bacterium]|nr:UbiA family prenyltransferase [Gammaproteobacteria bacterium]